METQETDKRLVDCFTGEVHPESEVGSFWSVADEESYQAGGGFDPFEDEDIEVVDWGCHLGDAAKV